MKESENIVIVGAGLAGLTLGYYLSQHNVPYTIIESNNRIGGRIYTDESYGEAPVELGATWFGKQHTELQKLLKELHLPWFEQILGDKAIYEPISTSPPMMVDLPKNNDPSFRIRGGTQQLIKALLNFIPKNALVTNCQVTAISFEQDNVQIKTNKGHISAKKVVSTLPPNLMTNTITFTPPLNKNLLEKARNTQTWMGESIKIALTYNQPFWRKENLSGTLFSNVGPISELYDHANAKDNLYALKGFLNGVYYNKTKAERQIIVLNQLERYYGLQIHNYVNYKEKVWRNDTHTFVPHKELVWPHQHHGDESYQKSYYQQKFWMIGTETSPQFGGYMEGAVRSAQRCFGEISL